MNKKVSILIISIILTIIVFGVSTYMQKQLVDYVPTIRCIVMRNDKEAFEKITEEDIKYVEMPISIVGTVKIIQDINDIQDLYLKDKIYEGQVLMLNQLDTKENLMIYQAEIGKEKIAIKIKAAENAVSYTIRENSIVNVYATVRSEYANGVLENLERQYIGQEGDGYAIIKILDSVKILGTFNSDGEAINDTSEKNIDTILVAVTPDEAKQISLISELATFHISELGKS